LTLTFALLRRFARAWLTIALLAAAAPAVWAQPSSAAGVAGRVIDPSGHALEGVVVAAMDGAGVQRCRALTADDGSYTLAPLAPGEYVATFALAGFREQRHVVRVTDARVAPLNVALALAAIPSVVNVVAAPDRNDPEQTIPEGIVYDASGLDLMPPHGSHAARITMAPGVTANGPGGAISISGGLSYGNLFLLDGLVINENLRGQARPFLIQDATAETRVATSAVTADYGRFQGGVVNTITKSGTNVLSGSVRAGFSNDRWRALTPFRGDATVNHRMPSVQVTAGGPVRLNRMWLFAAAELEQFEQNRTLAYTRTNYTSGQTERRVEAKLTWAISARQTARALLYRIDTRRTNASDGVVLERATFYDSTSPEALAGVTYTATIGRGLLFEAQYSNRQLTIDGIGSRDTTLTGGTPVWDRSRSDARFNSPAGCAVCDGATDERDNQNVRAKAAYTLATRRRGTHEMSAGLDGFQETRRNDSYQTGSGFRVRATRSNITSGSVTPVFLPDRTTWIYWMPILQAARGNDLRTASVFVSDTWRISPHLTARAGARFDYTRARDSLRAPVVRNGEVSPRAGVVWDVRKNGRLLLNAGAARYVSSITTNVADAASPAGRPSTYVYDYLGPAINADPKGPQLTSTDALAAVFNWFNANGGTGRAPRSAPSIPGVTTKIDRGLEPPDAREATAGVTIGVGQSGWLKVEGIYRTFGNFYARQRDLSTGRITDQSGRSYDLLIVTNTNAVTRTYRAVNAQVSTRIAKRGRISIAYTLSAARGSYDGETTNIGPDTAAYTDYPEYRSPSWSSPAGWLAVDQRHKLRATTTWDLPLAPSLGRLTLGLVQRYDSGRPWSAVGNVNPKSFVANPGYLTPPTSVPYFFSPRGAYRTAATASTDLSVSWSRRVPRTKRAQIYGRALLINAFNRSAVVNVGRTVLTRNDSATYQLFNPFTDTPIAGVHYGFGSDFGRPRTPGDYQPPREFTFSLGLRF